MLPPTTETPLATVNGTFASPKPVASSHLSLPGLEASLDAVTIPPGTLPSLGFWRPHPLVLPWHEFPVAALTDCHEPSDLKQHKGIVLWSQSSEVRNESAGQPSF